MGGCVTAPSKNCSGRRCRRGRGLYFSGGSGSLKPARMFLASPNDERLRARECRAGHGCGRLNPSGDGSDGSVQRSITRMRLSAYRHDLLRRSVPAKMRLAGYGIHPQIAATPAAGARRRAAGAVQHPGIPTALGEGHETRSVLVWTEPEQVSSPALRTLHAMANARCHAAPANHSRRSRDP